MLLAAPRRVLAGATPNGEVRLADIAQLPLVDFTPGWAIRYAVDRAFRAAGVDRSTTFEVNDIGAAAELVRNDLGVCIMPKSIADRFPDLPQYRFDQHAPTGRSWWYGPPARHPRRSPRCCATSPDGSGNASRPSRRHCTERHAGPRAFSCP
ncbi:LysR substrate-binding domain-containing protein [Streptomyces sp. NPDC002078]